MRAFPVPGRPLPLLALAVVLGGGFTLWPGLDIGVTAAAYDGDGFPAERSGWLQTLRHGLWNLTLLLPLAALAGLAVARWHRLFGLGAGLWGGVVAVYLLGPGLLVNVLLKEYWGRPRPADTTLFGGAEAFVAALVPGGACVSNCSFVSGEASGAAAFAICMAAILRARGRATALTDGALVALVALSAGLRVAMGRHFVSDVVLAVLFVLLVAHLVSWAIERLGGGRSQP